ncbi:MAG: hypothetical protein AB8I08_00600 [Sandaracinaceae bacterium]
MACAWPGWTIAVCMIAGCLIAGCAAERSVVLVQLQTDFRPGVEFDEVAVFSPRGREVVPATDGDYLSGRRVAELELGHTRRASVEVTLLDRGQPVARRAALLAVAGPTTITLLITRDCRDVMCTDGSTCVGGRCQDAACVTGDEPECARECRDDVDCPELDRCSSPRCNGGSCVYAADDTACDRSEVCIPETGCEPRDPVPRDAGLTDAGLSDAGLSDAGPCADVNCPSNQACRGGVCGPAFDCTPLPNDGDGDGIPDNRDPWPARCNTLLDYRILPDLAAPWTAPSPVTASEAGFTFGTGGMRRALSDPRFYMESTFTLGAIEDEDDWKVNLRVDSGDGEVVICHAYRVREVDEDFGGMGPRLRLAWEPADPIPASAGVYLFPEHPADFSPGQRYTLQMWMDLEGHITCQIADDAGPVGDATTTRGGAVPAITDLSGDLFIGVTNREATFERILIVEP